ncbi:MAG: hypothetical protein PUD20_12010 [bacterium]|nr:hypothetical protein [bacterium]
MSMTVSAAYVLRNAYSGNTDYRVGSFRSHSNNHDVVKADRRAMVRVLDRFESLDYDSKEQEDTQTIYNTVTTYLDIYNNTIKSAKASTSKEIRSSADEMKQLTRAYSAKLEKIGVTIKADGTVKVDKSELKKATTGQVANIFSSKSDYGNDMKTIMKKLQGRVNRHVPDLQSADGTSSLNLLV